MNVTNRRHRALVEAHCRVWMLRLPSDSSMSRYVIVDATFSTFIRCRPDNACDYCALDSRGQSRYYSTHVAVDAWEAMPIASVDAYN